MGARPPTLVHLRITFRLRWRIIAITAFLAIPGLEERLAEVTI